MRSRYHATSTEAPKATRKARESHCKLLTGRKVRRAIQILAICQFTQIESLALSNVFRKQEKGSLPYIPRLSLNSVRGRSFTKKYNLVCTIDVRNQKAIESYACIDFTWAHITHLKRDAVGPAEPQYHHSRLSVLLISSKEDLRPAIVPGLKRPPKLSRSIEP